MQRFSKTVFPYIVFEPQKYYQSVQSWMFVARGQVVTIFQAFHQQTIELAYISPRLHI